MFYDSSAVFQCYIMFHHVYVTIVRENDLTSKLNKFVHGVINVYFEPGYETSGYGAS